MTTPTEVTGHYASGVTRLSAFALDALFLSFSYGLILGMISLFVNLVSSSNVDLGESGGAWVIAGAVLWAFGYSTFSLAIAGRTPGKGIVGLRVVSREGSPITGRQATVRTVAFPLSGLVFGLGFLGIVTGPEHRAWHDKIAGTSVVYDWGDRSAELSTPLSKWLQRQGAPPLVDSHAESGGNAVDPSNPAD